VPPAYPPGYGPSPYGPGYPPQQYPQRPPQYPPNGAAPDSDALPEFPAAPPPISNLPAAPTDQPPPPPPAPNPLLDEQLRYHQVLGAYQRMPTRAPPPEATKSRGTYVRIADLSRRRHDGLYFRFALGIGVGHDHVTSSNPLPSVNVFSFLPKPLDASGTAFAGATEISLGFTPAPGLVLGVGSCTATIPKLFAKSKDVFTGDYIFRVSQLAILGPLVDWYFFPKYGFHAEASPGLATYVAGAGDAKVEGPLAQAHTAIGFGFALGVGYDFWIGDQWSAGFMGRVLYGTTSGSDGNGTNFTHTSYAPTLMFTLTYH
jgi:hypothetical protein